MIVRVPRSTVYEGAREGWFEERAPWRPWEPAGSTWIRTDGRADSVQWIDLPTSTPFDLAWAERHYFAWVPRLCAHLVQPNSLAAGELFLAPEPLAWPPLIFMRAREGDERRRVRPIEGGFLARAGGSLDFELLERPRGLRLVVAVRGLRPRLPLLLYLALQTPMHQRSSWAFLREVRRRVAATLGESARG